jgi:hypothetical protein
MTIERETVVRPVERETVVVERSGPGSGVLIGIILAVIVLLVIGGFTVFNGGFSVGGKSVTLDIPKVTVSK